MDGPAIISLRWDNILAVVLIIFGLSLIVVIPAQIFHWNKNSQGDGQ
jgi:hypothetical protein